MDERRVVAIDLPSALGPSCVGLRVVVRRVLPGQRGPTGAPAMTDVLGILVDWGATTLTVRSADGSVVVIERAQVVAGKPVPPRPSVRTRVPVEEAERRAMDSWPPIETQRVGDWLLRASGGFSARANSALLLGDPGTSWQQALTLVRDFYAARGQPAWVQAITGSESLGRLAEAGWVTARPGEADTSFRLTGTARALRAAQSHLPAEPPAVEVADHATDAWLADDSRAQASRLAAVAVLEGPPSVGFAGVASADGTLMAKGRVAASDRGEVWAGITDVWVAPGHRRRGLAVVIVHELLRWAAERGAGTAYLQVREDNAAALALYARLGFTPHHSYRYLRPPAPAPGQPHTTVSDAV